MRKTVLAVLAGSSMAAIVASGPAAAQAPGPAGAEEALEEAQGEEAEADAEEGEGAVDAAEIVVTGSQIRGIAPAGSAVISLGAKEVEATGAVSGFDVLARLPQSPCRATWRTRSSTR